MTINKHESNQEYQGSDGAVEGGEPEGDSTKSLVPQVSRMFIR